MTSDKTILCFGDSNTFGRPPMRDLDDFGRFGPSERWPGVLRANLGNGFHVVEEGHSGRTTVHADPVEGEHKNGLAALLAILETHMPLHAVVLMLGTNDLKARFGVSAPGNLPECSAAGSVGCHQRYRTEFCLAIDIADLSAANFRAKFSDGRISRRSREVKKAGALLQGRRGQMRHKFLERR